MCSGPGGKPLRELKPLRKPRPGLDEIGPILTAFIITGRVGAAICAELGSMRVTEQIDAMTCMGVDPLGYLVAPRFVSMGIMMPILTIF